MEIQAFDATTGSEMGATGSDYSRTASADSKVLSDAAFPADFKIGLTADADLISKVSTAKHVAAADVENPSTAVMVVPSAIIPAAWEVCEPFPETAAVAAATADGKFISPRGANTDTSDGTDTSDTASAPGNVHPDRLGFLNSLSKADLRLMSESWNLPRGGGRHTLIQRILAQLAAPNEG